MNVECCGNVIEMNYFRGICGVKRTDSVMNEIIKRKCRVKLSLVERAKIKVLKEFGEHE